MNITTTTQANQWGIESGYSVTEKSPYAGVPGNYGTACIATYLVTEIKLEMRSGTSQGLGSNYLPENHIATFRGKSCAHVLAQMEGICAESRKNQREISCECMLPQARKTLSALVVGANAAE